MEQLQLDKSLNLMSKSTNCDIFRNTKITQTGVVAMYSLMTRNKEVRNDRQMYAHLYAKTKGFNI